MEKGDAVIFINPSRIEYNAIVTNVWGTGPNPSLNVVYVSDDESKTDQYGRQIERATSIVHRSNQAAPAFCWRRIDE